MGKKCIKIPYNQADSVCGTPNNPIEKKGYTLVFQDEFEGELDTIHLKTAVNSTTEILAKNNTHTRKIKNGENIKGIYPKWRVSVGELGGCSPDLRAKAENAVCKDGKLSLQILKNADNSPKYSTAVVQSSTFIRYGYVEAKVKIPKGKSLWPSMWLYSEYPDQCIYQEIDIMEFIQNGNIDGDVFAGSVGHNPNKGSTWRYSSGRIVKKPPVCDKMDSRGFFVYPYTEGCNLGLKRIIDLSEDYFIYAAEWSKDSIVYYLNNMRIYSVPNDSSMQKLAMGLIMGCGMLRENSHTNIVCKDNLPNEYTLFPNEYSVEYVRFYKKDESFQEVLSLFPETENTDNQGFKSVSMREFYPDNEYNLQLFSEDGKEITNLESGYTETQYDMILLYKLPKDLASGNYFWKLNIQLFDGTKKEVRKKVQIL